MTCSSRSRAVAACATLLAAGLLARAAGGAAEVAPGLAERSFVLAHRPLDEAYRLVSPLLSDRADVRVLRSEGRLEIRDEPERLARVAEVLAAFDVEPRAVRLSVRVVKGEKRDEPGPPSEAARGVPRDVRELLGFNTFETLGNLELPVREGSRAAGLLGAEGRYRIDVRLGSVDLRAGTVEIERLSFERKLRGADGTWVFRPAFQFAEQLPLGRPRVLCATPGASDRRALFLVVVGSVD